MDRLHVASFFSGPRKKKEKKTRKEWFPFKGTNRKVASKKKGRAGFGAEGPTRLAFFGVSNLI